MYTENLYNSPDVASRIKEIAKSKGIQLKSILSECNLGTNTFSHMLHGKCIAFDSLAKIADYLNCSVDYLLGRVDTPKGTLGDDFSPHEKKLIAAYRNKPNMQESIDKLLDITGDSIEADIIETIKSGEAIFARKPTNTK